MAEDGLVVLVCPSGAEQAPISEGTVGYEAFHHHAAGCWLVAVPEPAAGHFCAGVAGFYRAPAALQHLRPR
jgi:hypothetical protein